MDAKKELNNLAEVGQDVIEFIKESAEAICIQFSAEATPTEKAKEVKEAFKEGVDVFEKLNNWPGFVGQNIDQLIDKAVDHIYGVGK